MILVIQVNSQKTMFFIRILAKLMYTLKTTTAMKKVIIFLIVAFFGCNAISASAQGSKKSKSSNDVELVKAAIDKESKAFFQIDYKTWADCWAHVPYAYWSFADTTDVNFFEGWESINKGFSEYFQTHKPSTAKMERKWLDVKVFGNSAYARFTQKVEDNVGRDEQAEVRVLERLNGQWKIVHVGVIAKQK